MRAKLIGAGRGGYCLELNGIFGEALAALGFTARPLLCRVRMGAPEAYLAWIVPRSTAATCSPTAASAAPLSPVR